MVCVSIRPWPKKVFLYGGGKSLGIEARDIVLEVFGVAFDGEDVIASFHP